MNRQASRVLEWIKLIYIISCGENQFSAQPIRSWKKPSIMDCARDLRFHRIWQNSITVWQFWILDYILSKRAKYFRSETQFRFNIRQKFRLHTLQKGSYFLTALFIMHIKHWQQVATSTPAMAVLLSSAMGPLPMPPAGAPSGMSYKLPNTPWWFCTLSHGLHYLS